MSVEKKLTATELEISKPTARRYTLGRQGLWPGRRFEGLEGVAAAIRAAEAIQVDTISVIERNHHLALWSRVAGYRPEWLHRLLYTDRLFFEYGGILFIYPMEEWPVWQPIMKRTSRWRERIRQEMPHLIEYARQRIESEGPLASRDFKGHTMVPGGFRVVKDVAQGLDYLWYHGELLIHSRRGNDRVYELTSRLLAEGSGHPPTLEQSEYYFAAKALRDLGLATPAELARRTLNIIQRRPSPAEARLWLNRMVAEGVAARLNIAGRPGTYYYPAQDTALLANLDRGQLPAAWQVPDPSTTTAEEVNFLAPLDNLIWDRARLKDLFDFEYIWEVYKPAPLRRWGYYTLPVLYHDRLVARLDPKLDRKTGLFSVQGFWLDEPELAADPAFARALAAGLSRLARFHQARTVDWQAVTAIIPVASNFPVVL